MGTANNDGKGVVNRRQVLGIGAALLVVAAALALPFKLFGSFSRNSRSGSDLPGEGSIFQPRKDANLERYLREKSD